MLIPHPTDMQGHIVFLQTISPRISAACHTAMPPPAEAPSDFPNIILSALVNSFAWNDPIAVLMALSVVTQ